MEKKFLEFSKSMTQSFLVVVFGALVVFVMWMQGYHK